MAAVTVTIPQGALRGRRLKTPSGRPYSSFQGIPYAKPPVGSLRFKSPEPPEKWTGIRNATKESNIAPQIDFLLSLKTEYEGDENCLYLNVYTPKLQTGGNHYLFPVMVWIHGGGLIVGSGNTDMYGPDYLMEHNVVLVTFNYRLGALGFLSTGDEVVPGNAGIKDQVMALKWIKSNISNFGGDPSNVTIFGESAGSLSCHFLMLSPATKGLFHRVICQSGVLSEGAVSTSVIENTFRLARSLGFSGDTSEELLAFMREQPAEKLVKNASDALPEEKKKDAERPPFGLTIESDGVPDSIMTKDPMEIMKRGDFVRMPMMVGITSREGLFLRQFLLMNKSALRDFNTNFQKFLPTELPIKKEERMSVAREIKRFYFGNQPIEESTSDICGDLRADLFFTYPSLRVAKFLSSVPAAQSVYFYHFDAVTNLNVFKKQAGGEDFPGATHCDDLQYLFSSLKTRDIEKGPDTVEGKAIMRMTRLWTNFATNGNPTPQPADPLLPMTWTPFKQNDSWYLDITNDGLSMNKDLRKEQMDFWEKIYRQ